MSVICLGVCSSHMDNKYYFLLSNRATDTMNVKQNTINVEKRMSFQLWFLEILFEESIIIICISHLPIRKSELKDFEIVFPPTKTQYCAFCLFNIHMHLTFNWINWWKHSQWFFFIYIFWNTLIYHSREVLLCILHILSWTWNLQSKHAHAHTPWKWAATFRSSELRLCIFYPKLNWILK